MIQGQGTHTRGQGYHNASCIHFLNVKLHYVLYFLFCFHVFMSPVVFFFALLTMYVEFSLLRSSEASCRGGKVNIDRDWGQADVREKREKGGLMDR